MKVKFRRGRKIGDPNYGSTEFGIELEMDVDDETFNDDVIFSKFCATNFSFADQLLEAERERIYASRPAQDVERVAGSVERNSYSRPTPHEPRPTSSSGDRAIEEARHRREPAAARNGVDHSRERPRSDMERSRNADRERDRPARDERRGGGGGKSYGPPRTGAQLFAWAKGHEERGADGFLKSLGGWCKDHDLPTRFSDLTADEIRDVYEAGQAMLDRSGGY